MIIAQISDTHISLDTPDAARRLSDLSAVVADINALEPGADLIVHTGDIVHSGLATEYAEARRLLLEARVPVYVLPGNKDDRAELRAAFSPDGYLSPGQDFIQYSVEGNPVRLVMLDTVSLDSGKGDFCTARVAGLRRLVDVCPDKPVAVFLHHPPFEVPVGPERMHFASAEAMSRLRAALQSSGRVIGVFCGHVHRLAEGRVGPIPVTVATAASTTLRKGEYPVHMTGRPVYLLHRLDPASGRVLTESRAAGA